MIKFIVLIFITFCSFTVYASDQLGGGFWSDIGHYLFVVFDFITVVIPQTIENFFVYIFTLAIKIKLSLTFSGVVFANDLATNLISDIGLNTLISNAVGALDGDLKSLLLDLGIFQGLAFLIEAGVTRLIYSFLN